MNRIYNILLETDNEMLENIFRFIVTKFGVTVAKNIIDKMTLDSFHRGPVNPFDEKSSISDLRKNLEFIRQKETEHSERYSDLIDAFCRKENYDTDEEEVFASHPVVRDPVVRDPVVGDPVVRQGVKCKGCGYMLCEHTHDLCWECENDRSIVKDNPDDDDGRKCAGCGLLFRHPDVVFDLCETCDEFREDIRKRLDDELDDYVRRRPQ